MHNHGMFEIDPTDSLLLTGLGSVLHPLLGMRGMEVRKGSGQQGYFEVRIVCRCPYGALLIGLTTNDELLVIPGIRPRRWLRGDQHTYAWCQDGSIIHPNGDSDILKFRTGDVVGLMVDCVEMPTLRFFMNGVLVHQLGLRQEDYGSILYPAFLLNFAQIHISSNPGLPIEF